MHLLDRVRHTIRTHDLAHPATRIVAAVSGGSDSVALAFILRELHHAGELTFTAIAHFNHQLRPGADQEATATRALADRLGVAFFGGHGDVRERATREHCSIELAARRSRHEFLQRARDEAGADVVALGHTRDDQAETVLLRLLRGAGTRGLAGMHPRRAHLIRPLIDCRRAALRAYLADHESTFADDESNHDVSIPRNRIRAELLPLLERRFNPAIVDVLGDEAEIARAEWRFIEDAAGELIRRAVSADGGVRRIAIAALVDAPRAVVRRLLARVLADGACGRPVTFAHVERARALAEDGGASMDGPGQRIERVGAELVLTSWEGRKGRPPGTLAEGPLNFFQLSLSIPGEVSSPAGWVISAARSDALPPNRAGACSDHLQEGTGSSAGVATIRLDRIREPLFVRNRRPGDRFSPPGLDGRKKLQDYFVDRKVARDRRDAVPIVVDADDRILWVAGHAVDREFAVTDPAQAVLILRLKQLGGGS